MYGWRIGRKALYAGTFVGILAVLGGAAMAGIVNPSTVATNPQIAGQGHIPGIPGVQVNDSGYTIFSYASAGVTPSPFLLCGAPYLTTGCSGGTYTQIELENATFSGIQVGDLLAFTQVYFNEGNGVPAQEVYILQLGVPGVFSSEIAVMTPHYWGANSWIVLTLLLDLGTITTPSSSVNVLVTDFGSCSHAHLTC